MGSHFFAYIARMKLIKRWSLMRNIVPENIQEHSLQVAMIAHILALAENKYFGGENDENEIALLAIYHDVGEVVIGDLPTPVKYFNPQIKEAYGAIEEVSKAKLISLLPQDLQEDYNQLFSPADEHKKRIIKAADKISAYIKCIEESMAGNHEFIKAEQSILKEIEKYTDMPQVKWFMDNFVESFRLTLDEME